MMPEAVVKILVVRDDVEVNTKDQDGRSPLSYVDEYGSEAEDACFAGQRRGEHQGRDWPFAAVIRRGKWA